MTIDEITLENFGVYRERQSMLTTPPSDTQPIILIGGLNGSGKTTLLDAIHLAFYGHRAKLAGRGRRSYGKYLQSMIHRGIEATDNASVGIKFSRIIDGKTQNYEILRSWSAGHSDEATEKLSVKLNGEEDKDLVENWQEHMDGILPIQMAHLFFFDGEQIADLADPNKAKDLLRTGIHSLLGLDLVDQLQNDLVVLERRKKLEMKPSAEQDELHALGDSLENLEDEIEKAHQQMGKFSAELGRAEKEYGNAKDDFRKEGGDLYEQQEELQQQKAELEASIHEAESTIRDLAAGAAPLCLVEHLLRDVKVQAEYEIEADKNRAVAGLLLERDDKLIQKLNKSKIPTPHIATVKKSLDLDRKGRPLVDPDTCYLGADESLVNQIDELTLFELPNVRKQMKEAKSSIENLQEDLDQVERKLARVPEVDAIAKLKNALDKTDKKVQNSKNNYNDAKHAWEILLDKKALIQARQSKIYGGQVDLSLNYDQSLRILNHMPRVLGTLNKFRDRVIRKHLANIERLILESFQQLLRKNKLVRTIKINPATYEIILGGFDGQELPFDQLSAGERQLLATAMLWGIIKASGRPLPLIIDTPLGRLDSIHRDLLTKHYFPVVSHQVFLLSTDEEIDQSLYRSLKSNVNNNYMLEHVDSEQRTQITSGYHWKTHLEIKNEISY